MAFPRLMCKYSPDSNNITVLIIAKISPTFSTTWSSREMTFQCLQQQICIGFLVTHFDKYQPNRYNLFLKLEYSIIYEL